MSSAIAPAEVEDFLTVLRIALEFYGATLEETEPVSDDMRSFWIPEAEVETRLTLLPAKRSRYRPVPEYLAFANSTFSPDGHRDLLHSDIGSNRLATMGAVSRDRRMLSSQGIIEPNSAQMLGAIMATAMMQAAPSILDGLQQERSPSLPSVFERDLPGEDPAYPLPRPESVWTQAEFERIHFELAHLGGGTLTDRAWNFPIGDAAVLSLTAADHHPYFGGGLLSRLTVAMDDFVVDGTLVPIEFINSVIILGGEDPAFGAWMAEEDAYSYVSFLPNRLMKLPCFEAHWVSWSLRRAMHVKALAEAGHMAFLKLGG